MVITSGLISNSPVARHVVKHGDGVKTLALWVENAQSAFDETVKRAAQPDQPFEVQKDAQGEVGVSSIKTYGDTVHRFVDRTGYDGPFLPGYESRSCVMEVIPVGLEYVDHCVGNVELGQMNHWVDFYEKVMGFKLLITFDDKDISTGYSALMSKVVSSGNGYIKFPINEPAKGKRKSQIEEYIEFYQ